MSDYDTDILVWSERQAELLRRHAAGELVRDLDWPNIIEEIESVASEHRFAVESHLVQAMLHMLKVIAWPESRAVPNWESEAVVFRSNAASRYTPSLCQRLDLAKLYRRALRAMPKTIDGTPPLPVPETCPWPLDELLADET